MLLRGGREDLDRGIPACSALPWQVAEAGSGVSGKEETLKLSHRHHIHRHVGSVMCNLALDAVPLHHCTSKLCFSTT